MMLQNRIGRLGAGVALAAVTLLLVPGLVLAHAELETPTPADKSTVTEPVAEVSALYSEAMKPEESTLVVKDPTGTEVAKGSIDPANDKRMVATPTVPLASGKYRVEWTSVSAEDGDVARGIWTFTVAVTATPAASVAASAAASATALPATAVATVVPSATPAGDGTAAGSSGDVVLPIIVALIVLGAGAAYLLSRRNRPTDQA
ncbi:MAG: copper resistance protein CopC [Chloroflexota bacterium]